MDLLPAYSDLLPLCDVRYAIAVNDLLPACDLHLLSDLHGQGMPCPYRPTEEEASGALLNWHVLPAILNWHRVRDLLYHCCTFFRPRTADDRWPPDPQFWGDRKAPPDPQFWGNLGWCLVEGAGRSEAGRLWPPDPQFWGDLEWGLADCSVAEWSRKQCPYPHPVHVYGTRQEQTFPMVSRSRPPYLCGSTCPNSPPGRGLSAP